MAVRVYEYGLREPTLGGPDVQDQMRLAHRYRNQLTEIERNRRQSIRAVIVAGAGDLEPVTTEIGTLSAEREKLRAEINKARAKSRSRVITPEQRAAMADLNTKIAELKKRAKEIKQKTAKDPEISSKIGKIELDARKAHKAARAKCGIYWGTYLLIEASNDQARKSTIDPSFVRSTHDPELQEILHQSWLDEGRLGVQIQGGMRPDELEADQRVRVTMPEWPEGCYELTKLDHKRRILWIRIGSDGRKPIWAKFPMVMSRPFPENCRIKYVTVSRRKKDCRRWTWSVQFQLDIPEREPEEKPVEFCALNLGWCQRADGSLRAGYVVGEDGYELEIVLPASIQQRIEKASSIHGYRDNDLLAMKAALVPWLHAHRDELPDWFVNRCILDRDGKEAFHIALWLSPERFARLAKVWRYRRFDGDAEGYDLIEKWRYRDEHLERYERGLDRKARLHRREIYRICAKRLTERYRTLVIDDFDLRVPQRSPSTTSTRVEIQAVKRQQQIVAPYQLRLTFMSTFSREGRIEKRSAIDITRMCNHCGTINEIDRFGGREHTCSGCHKTWDQDANACRNLLAKRELIVKEKKPSRSEKFRKRYQQQDSASA